MAKKNNGLFDTEEPIEEKVEKEVTEEPKKQVKKEGGTRLS